MRQIQFHDVRTIILFVTTYSYRSLITIHI
jgi:hypothetical protein